MNQLNIEKIGEPEIYQVAITGSMDASIAIELYQFFQNKSDIKEFRLLTTMKEFEGFKQIREFLRGIATDRMKNGKMSKNAIISDTKWVEKIIKMEDHLINRANIQFFSEDKREDALKWLKEN